VAKFYFGDERKYSPAALTDMRAAVVENATLAVLAVRHGFHEFFQHCMKSVDVASMDKFVHVQMKRMQRAVGNVSAIIIIKFNH
jgi:dsRNA-specific ribonuclease